MKRLFARIKLIWKGRAVATELLKIKSRWKEPVFWVTILGNALTLVTALQGSLKAEHAVIINTLLSAGYTYTRGLAKAQSDGVTPFKNTSEFLLGLATMANNAIIDLQTGGVAVPYLAASGAILYHAAAANRDLANMRPKEAAAEGVTPEPAIK